MNRQPTGARVNAFIHVSTVSPEKITIDRNAEMTKEVIFKISVFTCLYITSLSYCFIAKNLKSLINDKKFHRNRFHLYLLKSKKFGSIAETVDFEPPSFCFQMNRAHMYTPTTANVHVKRLTFSYRVKVSSGQEISNL